MKRYRKRIADDILIRKLEGKGAVLIEGPKWCGKTTTAEQLAASILYMDDPEKKEQNIAMSELNPKRLLKGATPRLIDEWQLAPKLWTQSGLRLTIVASLDSSFSPALLFPLTPGKLPIPVQDASLG